MLQLKRPKLNSKKSKKVVTIGSLWLIGLNVSYNQLACAVFKVDGHKKVLEVVILSR